MSHDTTMLHSVSTVLGVHPAIPVVKIGKSGKRSSISRLFRQTLTPGFFIAEPHLPLKNDPAPKVWAGSQLLNPTKDFAEGGLRRGHFSHLKCCVPQTY
jgi:hypothetical protein